MGRLSISSRILLGFGLVLASLICVAAVSYWGLETTRKNFLSFRTLTERALDIQEIDAEISGLVSSVESYIFTSQNSLAGRIEEDIGRLSTRLAAFEPFLQSEKEADLHGRMIGHLEVYRKTFFLVRKAISRREGLLREDFPSYKADFLNMLKSSGPKSGLVNLTNDLELSLLNYVVNLDSKRLMTDINLFSKAYTKILRDGELRSMADRFRKVCLDVMQTSQGFLYLTNVVMAGEASEFLYVSAKLRSKILTPVPSLISGILTESSSGQKIVLGVSLGAILFGFLVALFIARGISKPLGQITQVFRQLSKGEPAPSIPGMDRRDEIGVLANAANLFRLKDVETKTLLDQTRQMADQLAASERSLARSNDELEQFVYTVSHDLKSPLVTNMGFLGMIEEMISQGKKDEALEKLPRLRKANERMSELITDLLELSRVGRTDMSMDSVDLNDLIQRLLESGELNYKDQGMTIHVDKALGRVHGNESRLLQIFENLVSNALKYGRPTDGRPLKVEIGLAKSQPDDEQTLIYFRDNGPGIMPEYHDKVFGLFQRLTNDKEGTGLGLAIVKKIMKFHEGTVWIESQGTGDGCTFWLQFVKYREEGHERII